MKWLCPCCTLYMLAGLGEACSHIAGLFFTLEANSKMKNQTSCASFPCSWLPPSFQNVSYEPIAKIKFSLPKLGGATRTDCTTSSAASKSIKVKEPSELEKRKKNV